MDVIWGPLILYTIVMLVIDVIVSSVLATNYGSKSWKTAAGNGCVSIIEGVIAFAISTSYAESYRTADKWLYGYFIIMAIAGVIIGVVYWIVGLARKAESDSQEEMSIPYGMPVGASTQRARVTVSEVGMGKVRFQLEDGRELHLVTSLNNYRVGETGMLIWQGNRIVSFDRLAVSAVATKPVEEKKTQTMQLIKCPICKTQQKAGRRICFRCGHMFTPEEANPKLTETVEKEENSERKNCPDCGAQLQVGMSFCICCGKALKQENCGWQVFCHNCGTKQVYGNGKCIACGTQLVKLQPEYVFCYKCGKKQEHGSGKCVACGTELVKDN